MPTPKEKINSRIQQIQKGLDSLKGRYDEGSRRKKEKLTNILDKLRAEKKKQKPNDSDNKETLSARIDELEAKLKLKKKAMSKKSELLKEKAKEITDSNALLEALYNKEKKKVELAFHEKILKHVKDGESKSRFSKKIKELKNLLLKNEDSFSQVIKDVDDSFKDNDKVAKAKAESEEKLKTQNLEARKEAIESELENIGDGEAGESRKESLKKELDNIKNDLDQTKGSDQEDKKETEDEKKLREYKKAMQDLENQKGKKAEDQRGILKVAIKSLEDKLDK